MTDSAAAVRAVRAADGIAVTSDAMHRQGFSSDVLATLRNSMEGISLLDQLRGAAMLKKLIYRT